MIQWWIIIIKKYILFDKIPDILSNLLFINVIIIFSKTHILNILSVEVRLILRLWLDIFTRSGFSNASVSRKSAQSADNRICYKYALYYKYTLGHSGHLISFDTYTTACRDSKSPRIHMLEREGKEGTVSSVSRDRISPITRYFSHRSTCLLFPERDTDKICLSLTSILPLGAHPSRISAFSISAGRSLWARDNGERSSACAIVTRVTVAAARDVTLFLFPAIQDALLHLVTSLISGKAISLRWGNVAVYKQKTLQIKKETL